MNLEIPPERTFDVPAGSYRMRLVNARPIDKYSGGKMKTFARLTFEEVNPRHPGLIFTAARNFEMSRHKGSKLRVFLESWLGKAFLAEQGSKLQLDSLLGREADVLIHHIENPEHDQPYCFLAAIYPVGTLEAARPVFVGGGI